MHMACLVSRGGGRWKVNGTVVGSVNVKSMLNTVVSVGLSISIYNFSPE